MKVGLFGGSFNPIHNEHLRMMRYVLDKKIVDEVWIMPCKIHPFNKALISARERVEMIKMALKGMSNVKISQIELESKGKNYTADTIKKLKKRYRHKFFFIIGFDILKQIERWYKHRQLFKETEFIVFRRENYPFREIKGMKIAHLIDWKEKDISSTMTRERAKEGKSIKGLVPVEVEEYIRKKCLYA